MKTAGSPFAIIDGKPFVIENFTLEPAFGCPALREILEELLGQYSGKDILLLRRLKKKERKLLEKCTQDFEHEAWAQISAMSKARKD